jgi:hypothetical protein
MKKTLVLFFLGLVSVTAGISQIINKEPLSLRQTYYRIDAELDPVSKTVNGYMEAYWVNLSADMVPDIQLHMYMNAFRSNKTTLYTESGGSPGSKKSHYGWIEIESFTDRMGSDLMERMQFITPDDDNNDDQTVLQVVLPTSAQPGDTVFIRVNFETKLPSQIRRTGYSDDFFFVAQWFPKFGVYENEGMRFATKGGWNCHQFHENSEFYSNHSVYDVNITVPREYIVGSGGLLMSEKENVADSALITKTLCYRAEDIVDFAWTAWPGYKVFNEKWNHVDITLLIPESRIEQVDRQFGAVKNALEYLDERVGPYPWPHLTFVDPPTIGAGAGGMEYTTLFTSTSSASIPDFLYIPEMVTIHEFGHAYFMGILASNEFEEPWLDEGINSFWEERIMDNYYGPEAGILNHPWLKISDKTMGRSSYLLSENKKIVSNAEYSWNYPHNTYGMMSYQKAATWLYTLMGLIGEETTDEVFREYYKRWAFKHPSGKDFIAVVNDVVTSVHGDKFGTDMNWFFDQFLYGDGILDYKVYNFTNKKIAGFSGVVSGADSLEFISNKHKDDTIYKSVVKLERPGDIILPVEVLIHFDDDEEITEQWDGKARFKDFTYTGTRKVEWVKIDPEYKIRMDVNFINNSLTNKPDKIPVRRFTNKYIIFMQFLVNFITL